MAVSNIMPRKVMRNRTRRQSMAERNEYDQKAEKTRDGDLVSSYMCSPETAAEEFEISKRLYAKLTGRTQSADEDIIMYRVIQSFKPGEVSPEEANRIGYELAMKFTGGRHQFVVSTHVDKAHIHNHIEFNSTNLNCDGKFHAHNSSFILRRINDEICSAHGLSVIRNPKEKAKTQKEAAAAQYGTSHKECLRRSIDRILADCKDYEEFLARMRDEGYEVKEGKNLSFRAPGWDRFTRTKTLGDDYILEALMERANRPRGRSAQAERPAKEVPGYGSGHRAAQMVTRMIDIQKKLAQGKGEGYERWAKIFNLQTAAKTLNYLIDHDLADYDKLTAAVEQAGTRFDEASKKIKRLEARMAEVAQLKTHIIRYAKTKDIYTAYQKSRHKKEFRAEHAEEIAWHEAAKEAFNALGGRPIPKVAQLSEQYAALLAEKKACYEEYKAARQEMLDYQTAKQNIDKVLGLDAQAEQARQTQQYDR